jgi:NAD(P)-dependent dehydrogenase (short-subunit alcohol dehydrogenase family)
LNEKDFIAITDEDWMKYFNANVMTTVRVCRHFLPQMISRDFGRVVIIASECGMKPIPDMIHYSVTKSAQIGLARGLAEMTKGTGVTVNSVLPGPTATEGLVSYFRGLAEKEGVDETTVVHNYFKTKEPTSLIQRLIKVEEVAHVILFLASESAGAVNGNTQRVEGGIIRSI